MASVAWAEEVEDLSPEARDRYISQVQEEMEDEDDGLDWSWRYVALCVLLPCLNGCANGFAWAAVGLYFRSMQWPLWHCGLAGASGFVLRWLCQQLQLRVGLWVTLPLSMCHLSAAILAIVYSDQEWAIMGQMICLHGFDPTMCIEGVVYDAFRCRGERISSQATSTALSIMALMAALASTAGGLIYDYFNWQGMAVFHTSTQSLILLILLIHPTCRRSFMEVFFRKKAKSSKKLRSRTEATENERGKQKEGASHADGDVEESVFPLELGDSQSKCLGQIGVGEKSQALQSQHWLVLQERYWYPLMLSFLGMYLVLMRSCGHARETAMRESTEHTDDRNWLLLLLVDTVLPLDVLEREHWLKWRLLTLHVRLVMVLLILNHQVEYQIVQWLARLLAVALEAKEAWVEVALHWAELPTALLCHLSIEDLCLVLRNHKALYIERNIKSSALAGFEAWWNLLRVRFTCQAELSPNHFQWQPTPGAEREIY
ncbi:unnamed protein product [Durusdinium trenchii]|uniref:Solute carrier family 40 protein n=1 Tax=Durusdinium trenchii TaxID=1381693 RepID=A0ABP0PH03_9DINO